MRFGVRVSFLLAAAVAASTFAGCRYRVEPGSDRTVAWALGVIRDCERKQLAAAGPDIASQCPASLIDASTYSFTDFYLDSVTHEDVVIEGHAYGRTERTFRLREVAFAGIAPVERSWNPLYIFVPILSFGLIGPFLCDLESPDARTVSGPWALESGNVLPFWLVGAWFWWSPDSELSAYAEALEVLRRNASGGWEGPTAERGEVACRGRCCPDGGNTCSCTSWGQCGMASCRPE